MSDNNWYGIPGIKFHFQGINREPLIEYKGVTFFASVVEDTMWELFMEDNDDISMEAFDAYMLENKQDVYEFCELAIQD